jgi:hypothetical protein
MKNFNRNISIVNRIVIDESKRYKPQSTSRTILFLNIIVERTLSSNPVTIKIIVNAKLILIING